MKCADCIEGTSKEACEACRQMQQEGEWIWYIDVGSRHIRCPYCGSGERVGCYVYENRRRFCSYCGKQLIKVQQMSMFEEGTE